MTISMHDTGVADLIYLYSVRECLVRRLPELESSVAVAADRPKLTVTTAMGRGVLEKSRAGWSVVDPTGPEVRFISDPAEAAAALTVLALGGSRARARRAS